MKHVYLEPLNELLLSLLTYDPNFYAQEGDGGDSDDDFEYRFCFF